MSHLIHFVVQLFLICEKLKLCVVWHHFSMQQLAIGSDCLTKLDNWLLAFEYISHEQNGLFLYNFFFENYDIVV